MQIASESFIVASYSYICSYVCSNTVKCTCLSLTAKTPFMYLCVLCVMLFTFPIYLYLHKCVQNFWVFVYIECICLISSYFKISRFKLSRVSISYYCVRLWQPCMVVIFWKGCPNIVSKFVATTHVATV